MRVDFKTDEGRECWATFDDQGNIQQLACKAWVAAWRWRSTEWVASGQHAYEWQHLPLFGEIALYAHRVRNAALS